MIKMQNKIKNYLKEIKEGKKTSQLLKYISDMQTYADVYALELNIELGARNLFNFLCCCPANLMV